MNSYGNHGGQSNIVGYENSESSIKVNFSDGSVYEYTDQSCGKETVRIMQRFAGSGVGLNGFISRSKPKYATKS